MTIRSHRLAIVGVAALVVSLLSACGSGFDDDGPEQQSGPAELDVLIGSSGDAETRAVQAAAEAWNTATGNTATVTPAQDITQQLGQAFAGDNPPDVFYVDASRFADYAAVGALEPYGDKVSGVDDFYAPLRQTFTRDGTLYCVPKDFSTLALQINTKLWTDAGLTDADVPTTWDELTAVSATLSEAGTVPLAIDGTRDRLGAFMVQAGGWIVDADGTTATADSPQNRQALEYVKGLLDKGYAQYPGRLDVGWPGEAFGKEKVAMTIEGNWLAGAMTADFPEVEYTVHPLPAGPAGPGTLSFTQCWGISAHSDAKEQAIDFVEAMTSVDQQLAFAEGFGVMPSRASARDAYVEKFADDTAYIDGAEYAQGPVNAPKMDDVLADFDAQLQQLADLDPADILEQLQANAQAALDEQ